MNNVVECQKKRDDFLSKMNRDYGVALTEEHLSFIWRLSAEICRKDQRKVRGRHPLARLIDSEYKQLVSLRDVYHAQHETLSNLSTSDRLTLCSPSPEQRIGAMLKAIDQQLQYLSFFLESQLFKAPSEEHAALPWMSGEITVTTRRNSRGRAANPCSEKVIVYLISRAIDTLFPQVLTKDQTVKLIAELLCHFNGIPGYSGSDWAEKWESIRSMVHQIEKGVSEGLVIIENPSLPAG